MAGRGPVFYLTPSAASESTGGGRSMASTPSQQAIQLDSVTRRFSTPSGGVHTALEDLDLVVAPGEFCAVVGPTGCGKSTTLTLISGLERPSRGAVTVEGRP